MAKPNYSAAKRARDLAKKKKQEEKRQRRQERRADDAPGGTDGDETQDEGAPAAQAPASDENKEPAP